MNRVQVVLIVIVMGLPGLGRADDFTAVDRAADRYLEITGLPGAGLAVVDRDGTIHHEKFYGSYDANTVVSIASASKWLAGAAIMAQVDAGKLDLDQPVGTWVPPFATGRKATITLRQLFNHTSGLPDGKEAKQNAPFMREAAENIAKLPLQFDPGTAFFYGGAAMQVGGRVAEVAGGDTWQALFEATISGPLDLQQTAFATGEFNFNPQVAGGARSSLRDYTRFLLMILNEGELDGVRVLSAEAVREMLADRTGEGITVHRATAARRANFTGYGVGCWTEDKDTEGNTVVATSPGAFGFYPWIDLERGIAAVWMIEDRDRVRNRHPKLPNLRQQVEAAIPVRSGGAVPESE